MAERHIAPADARAVLLRRTTSDRIRNVLIIIPMIVVSSPGFTAA